MSAVLNIPTDEEIHEHVDDPANALTLKGLAAYQRGLAEQDALTMIPKMMSSSVEEVLANRRNRLHQIRSIIAGAYAIAEANDDSGDVRWTLESALEQFMSAIDSLETHAICRDAGAEDREAAAAQAANGISDHELNLEMLGLAEHRQREAERVNLTRSQLDAGLYTQAEKLFVAESIIETIEEALTLRFGRDWQLDVPDYRRPLRQAAALIRDAYGNLEVVALERDVAARAGSVQS
jgi:hypothetical protein